MPIHYAPSFDAWPKDMLSDVDDQETVDFTGVIDATDAAAAFAVTFDDPDSATYSTRQRIAADVNEDGVVNSIDALSIMDINNGAAWYTNNPDLGLKRWSFFTTASVEDQDAETYSSSVRAMHSYRRSKQHSHPVKCSQARTSSVCFAEM
jgi:hypothetical protein